MTVKMLNTQAMFDRWYVEREGHSYDCSVVHREEDISFVSYGFGRLLKEHPEYEGKLVFISEGSWIQPLLKKVNRDWAVDPSNPSSALLEVRFPALEQKFRKQLASTCNLSLKTVLDKLDPKERRTKKLLSFWFRRFIKEHKERLRRGEFAIKLTWDDRRIGTGAVCFYKFLMTELHYSPCCIAREVTFPRGQRDWTYFLSQLYLRKKYIFSEEEVHSFREESQRLFPEGNGDENKWTRMFSLRIDMRRQEFFHFSLWGKLVYRFLKVKKFILRIFNTPS
jgi:hypothetical protein